jgi:hypothetical protein
MGDILIGRYNYAPKRFGHWQGSFTVKIIDSTPPEMSEYYSGFEEDTQKVIGSTYNLVRVPS